MPSPIMHTQRASTTLMTFTQRMRSISIEHANDFEGGDEHMACDVVQERNQPQNAPGARQIKVLQLSSNQRDVRCLPLYDVTRVFAEKESYESNLCMLESQQQRAADARDIAVNALPTLEPNGENIKAKRVFAGAAARRGWTNWSISDCAGDCTAPKAM